MERPTFENVVAIYMAEMPKEVAADILKGQERALFDKTCERWKRSDILALLDGFELDIKQCAMALAALRMAIRALGEEQS